MSPDYLDSMASCGADWALLSGARPIFERVDGAPYQPGERVRVVQAIDQEVSDLRAFIGRSGVVLYLEYSCGCGQTYPEDPMIGVRLDDGAEQEFWPEELELELPVRLVTYDDLGRS